MQNLVLNAIHMIIVSLSNVNVRLVLIHSLARKIEWIDNTLANSQIHVCARKGKWR